ncbi:MAG TPA: hypothetical protein DIT05_17885 [Morganella sp. (in: Bacteria)]|nr:hypothetical protein [Morganella sp. (in: enterobacteria)]
MSYQNDKYILIKSNSTSWCKPNNPSIVGEYSYSHSNKFTNLGFLAFLIGSIIYFSPVTNLSFLKVVNHESIKTFNNENIRVKALNHEDSMVDSNPIELSNDLRELFGFKISHWANILKVERKTLYNWKSNSDINIKSDALSRLSVLNEFSSKFRAEHKKFFAKMIFGRYSNKELLVAFTREKLDLQEILDAYDNVYDDLDGFITRADILS